MKIWFIYFLDKMCQQLFFIKLISLILFLSMFLGCNFKLKYNHDSLPNKAKSLEIINVKNLTKEISLNLQLLKKVTFYFKKEENIILSEKNFGDLKLNMTVYSFNIKKKRHSLTSKQNFEYIFSSTVSLSLFDNRFDNYILKDELITSIFRFKTSLNKLSQFEKDNGKKKLLELTSKKIYQKTTQFF